MEVAIKNKSVLNKPSLPVKANSSLFVLLFTVLAHGCSSGDDSSSVIIEEEITSEPPALDGPVEEVADQREISNVDEWTLTSYVKSNGDPGVILDGFVPRISFEITNTVRLVYECGGFEGSYFADNGILTIDAESVDDETDCNPSGSLDQETNRFLSDALMNSVSIHLLDNSELKVTTERNEIIIFSSLE